MPDESIYLLLHFFSKKIILEALGIQTKLSNEKDKLLTASKDKEINNWI